MYIAYGWPKVLNGLNSRDHRALYVGSGGGLLVVVYNHAVQVWSDAQHRVRLGQWIRDAASLTQDGANVQALWNSNLDTLAVLTSGNVLHFYDVRLTQKELQLSSLSPLTLAQVKFRSSTKIPLFGDNVSVSGLVGDDDNLLLGSSNGRLHLVSWRGQVRGSTDLWRKHNREVMGPMFLPEANWLPSSSHSPRSSLSSPRFSTTPTSASQAAPGPASAPPALNANGLPSSPGILHLALAEELRLLAVALLDGRVVLCSVGEDGLRPVEDIVPEKWVGVADAVCLALGAKQQLLAVGSRRGTVELFDLSKSSMHLRAVSLFDWGYSVEDTGPVKCIVWSPDSWAFAVGWRDRGMAVWTISGCRLVCTIRQGSMSNLSMASPMHQQSPRHAPGAPSRQGEPMVNGVAALVWCEHGYHLIAAEGGALGLGKGLSAPRLLQFSLARGCMNKAVAGSAHVWQMMSGEDRVLLVQSTEREELRLQHLIIPQTYIGMNWPVRHVTASDDGLYLAVAGRRGVILHNLRHRKWRVFGDVRQEKAMRCVGLLWLGKILVVANHNETTNGYELCLYPRFHLDESSLLFRQPLPAKPIALDCWNDFILVATPPFEIRVFHVHVDGELSPLNIPTTQVATVRELSIMTVRKPLVAMRFLPWSEEWEEHKRQQTRGQEYHKQEQPEAAGGQQQEAGAQQREAGGAAAAVEVSQAAAAPAGLKGASTSFQALSLEARQQQQQQLRGRAAGAPAVLMNGTVHPLGSSSGADFISSDSSAYRMLRRSSSSGSVISLSDAVKAPARKQSYQQVVAAAVTRQPTRCMILRVDGELSLLDLDSGSEKSLVSGVEHFWLTQGREAAEAALIQEVPWWAYGHRGMQVWYPSLEREPQAMSADMQQLDPELDFDREVYPLGVSPAAGVILGVSQRLALTSCSDMPCFEPTPQAQPILPCLLRHLLQLNKVQEAVQLALLSSSRPHFSHSLEWLLFTIFDAEMASQSQRRKRKEQEKGSTMLKRACDLIRFFTQYLDVVVSVARKTDSRHWGELFAAAGKSSDLFEECFQRKQFRTATCYILVIEKLEGPTSGQQNALRLLQATLHAALYELAGELVRFLLRSGREYSHASTLSSPPSHHRAESDKRSGDSLLKSFFSFGFTTASARERGDVLHATVNHILSEHALVLLTAKELRELVAFVKGTLFDLTDFLRSQRGKSARLEDFPSALKTIRQKLMVEGLQSRMDAEFLLAHMRTVGFHEWTVVLATILGRAEVLVELFKNDAKLWHAYVGALKAQPNAAQYNDLVAELERELKSAHGAEAAQRQEAGDSSATARGPGGAEGRGDTEQAPFRIANATVPRP